jgi:type IX secretion system PorP/SprF family membrane protein
LSIIKLFGQDVQFSQFYTANQFLAPSFAGSTPGGRAMLMYRNQWPEIQNQFNTYHLSVDHYYPKYHCGLGLYMLRDVVGAAKLVTSSYQLQYSYLFRITRAIHVKPGLQVGYASRRLNGNLLFGDQLSFIENKPISNENGKIKSVHMFDYAASVLFYVENAWQGVSLDHLPFPNQSMMGGENASPMKLSVFGGIRFLVKDRLLLRERNFLTLSYLYKKQGVYQQLDLGLSYTKFPVEVGIWYRGLPVLKNTYTTINQDAIVTKIGVEFEQFSIGYSYDFTFSELRSYSGGAHEISIVYLFHQDQEPDKKKFKALPCPKI